MNEPLEISSCNLKHFATFLLLLSPNLLYAEAITDGTVGKVQSLNGKFEIPASLGTTSGTNLFHSFQTFNINSGESATFTGSDNILNVISRVTGGSVSNINGTISSKVGNADFYFINPAGIIFGKSAKLDVPSSFYATTSDDLHFKDGLNFNAVDLKNNKLSISTPEQFGLTTASIANNSLLEVDGSNLTVNSKQSLNLSAGDINIHNFAKLNAPEGEIQLITPLKAGKINITDIKNFSVDGNGSGKIALEGENIELNNSIVSASNFGANNTNGGISAKASELNVTQSYIFANTYDVGHASNIDIHVQNLLLAKNTIISSDTSSSGDAGNISINSVGTVTLQDKSKLSSNTSDIGNAGNINIYARDVLLTKESIISSDTYSSGVGGTVTVSDANTITAQEGGNFSATSYSTGAGGKVNLNANTIKFDGKNLDEVITGVVTNARKSGDAGQAEINTSAIEILAGASITSSTFGTGDAKSVVVNAHTLTVDGKNNIFNQTGIGSNANPGSDGHAGDVLVKTDYLTMLNGGEITSQTFGTGNAGNVKIDAKKIINIDGRNSTTMTGIGSDANFSGDAGVINVDTPELIIKNTGVISSNTFSSGNAGAVNINANNLNIDGKESIDPSFTGISSNANKEATGKAGNLNVHSSNIKIAEKGRVVSNTYGQGNAGNVNIQTNNLSIDGRNSDIYTGIASNAYELSKGNAGNVTVDAKNIDLTNAGRITTNTRGSGIAGDVIIKANTINIDAKNSEYLAGIASAASPDSSGQTGSINITANNQLNLSNAAQISIQSRANVPNPTSVTAGQINISTPVLNVTNNAIINAKATENTNASNINLHISNALQMNLGSISTQANSGNGGAIEIDSGRMDLQRSSITTSVASEMGNGGNITVSSPALILDNGMVQANAYSGHGGDVFIKVDSLIGSQSQLLQGGEKPVVWQNNIPGFNVIQAASQLGLSGTVNVTSPQMNLSGILAGLSTSSFARDVLSQDYCNIGAGSSLTVRGYGALPSKSTDLLY